MATSVPPKKPGDQDLAPRPVQALGTLVDGAVERLLQVVLDRAVGVAQLAPVGLGHRTLLVLPV
jgi:hypothetical protein